MRAAWTVPVLAVVAAAALGLAALAGGGTARAQAPEDESLRIERQLLCPQCTNLRLDVCETRLCADMRGEIRDRLARGESEQQIIDYFRGVYGQRVLADIPRQGFNLVLFGWVAAALAVVAGGGGFVLLRMRRTAVAASDAGGEVDDRWLDEQLRESSPDGGR